MKSVDFTILLDRAWDAFAGLASATGQPVAVTTGIMLRFWNSWNARQLRQIAEDEVKRAAKEGNSPLPCVTVTTQQLAIRWSAAVGRPTTPPEPETLCAFGFLAPHGEGKWRVCGMSMRLGYFLERTERDEVDDYFSRIPSDDWQRVGRLASVVEQEKECASIGAIAWWRRLLATPETLERAHRIAMETQTKAVMRVSENSAMDSWRSLTRGTAIEGIGLQELVEAGLLSDCRCESDGRRTWAFDVRDNAGMLVTHAIRELKKINGHRSQEKRKKLRQLPLPLNSRRTREEYEYFRNYTDENKIRRKFFVPEEDGEEISDVEVNTRNHNIDNATALENLTQKSRMSTDKEQDKLHIQHSTGIEHGGGVTPSPQNHIQNIRGGEKSDNKPQQAPHVKKYSWREAVTRCAAKMAHVFEKTLGAQYLVETSDMKAISNWLVEHPEISEERILRVWEVGLRSNRWPRIRNIREILKPSNWNYYSSGGAEPSRRGVVAVELPGASVEASEGRREAQSAPAHVEVALNVLPRTETSCASSLEQVADRQAEHCVAQAHVTAPDVEARLETLHERAEKLEVEFMGMSSSPQRDTLMERASKVRQKINRTEVALEIFGKDAGLALCGAPLTAAWRATEGWALTDLRRGLLLTGPQGTGKTFAAKLFGFKKGERYFSENYGAKISEVVQLHEATALSGIGTFEAWQQKFWDAVKSARILVLDDLGKEAVNKVWTQNLFEVLNARLSRGWKTIITTNLSHEELRARYGVAIFERLVALCEVVHVKSAARYEVLSPLVNDGNLRAVLRRVASEEAVSEESEEVPV